MKLLVLAILLTATQVSAAPARAQVPNEIIRGTVNVVLANSHGIVVLTDSKGTIKNSAGQRPSAQDSQKLIRLDDRSVCAIAGFGSARVGSSLQFGVDVMGILTNFRDQLSSKKSQLSFHEKLRTISFLLQAELRGLANIEEVVAPQKIRDDKLTFSMFLVGYDSDGKPRIGTLILRAAPNVVIGGKTQWEISDRVQLTEIGGDLQYDLAGMWDVGSDIFTRPQLHTQNPVGWKLWESAADHGASLQINDLVEIAKFISAETHTKYPDQVGGQDQIAIFQDGGITKFEQQSFPTAPKPMQFLLLMDIPIVFAAGVGIQTPKGVPIIWIRCTIDGYVYLPIDGNFYLGNEIRNSYVTYDGGPMFFDPSNKVVNSRIEIGFPIGSNEAIKRYLVQNFHWSECIPVGCENY